MKAEAFLMAAAVWYVTGWMRTEVPQEGVMSAMSNVFPKAEKSVQGVGRRQGGVSGEIRHPRAAENLLYYSRPLELNIAGTRLQEGTFEKSAG